MAVGRPGYGSGYGDRREAPTYSIDYHEFMALTVDPRHPNFDREAFIKAIRDQAKEQGWEFHAPIDLDDLSPEKRAELQSLFAA